VAELKADKLEVMAPNGTTGVLLFFCLNHYLFLLCFLLEIWISNDLLFNE